MGLILSWKWTAINILISSVGTIIRLILYLEDIQIASLCLWVAYPPPSPDKKPQLLLFIVIGFTCLAILLTILLAHSDLQYRVILPSKLAIPHVLNNGAVVPLVRQSPPGFSRKSIRRKVLVAIKWFVALALLFSFFSAIIGVRDWKWTLFDGIKIVPYDDDQESFDPYKDELGFKKLGKYDFCYY